MTAFKHLRRRPAVPNTRFGIAGAPTRFIADTWPAFASGPFRDAIRTVTKPSNKPGKPHLR